jgi:hypothetical protein
MLDLTQVDRKREWFGSGFLDRGSNLFKRLRISRGQHNGGEISS